MILIANIVLFRNGFSKFAVVSTEWKVGPSVSLKFQAGFCNRIEIQPGWFFGGRRSVDVAFVAKYAK